MSRELPQEPAAFAFESLWSDDSFCVLPGQETCNQISTLLLISYWVPFTNVSMALFLTNSKEEDDDENSNTYILGIFVKIMGVKTYQSLRNMFGMY